MTLLVLLKIAGVCVLVLLVLLLVTLLLLLAVPFRYELSERSRGKYPEGKLVLSWLWRGLWLRLDADPQKALTGELKLFGYRYLRICYRFRSLEENETEDTVTGETEEGTGSTGAETVPEEKESFQTLNCLFDDTANTVSGTEVTELSSGEETAEEPDKKGSRESREKRHRERRDRLEVFLRNCLDFLKSGADKIFTRLKEDVEKLKNSSEGITGKLKELLGLYKSGEYKDSVHLFKEQLFRLLQEILPRSGNGTIEYGLGDPFNTGKVLEVLAFFYPLYGKTFQITPYFEEKKLDTDISVQGRVCLGVILICVIRTAADRGLRKLAGETRRIIRES